MTSDPIGLAGGINTYGYALQNPVNNIDPDGQICISVNGRMTCSFPGGPAFTVPSPSEQPRSITLTSPFHHETNVSRALDGASAECVMRELINNPTPGNPRPATPSGTRNNAQVPFVTRSNHVTSYLTRAHGSGIPIVVNTAGINDGSAFGPGYVARYVLDGRAHPVGEGTDPVQSIDRVGDVANELLWGAQLERIIEECKCE